MPEGAEIALSASDLAELPAEDRQFAMFRMPIRDLILVIDGLMKNGRLTEINARLDALSILAIRQT